MRFCEKICAATLAVVLLLSLFVPFFGLGAPEITPMNKIGIVATQNSNLNVRDNPGTNGTVLFTLSKGSVVDVIGSVKLSETDEWYNIRANGKTGYASSKYITLRDIPEDTDEAFELELSAFPESYRDGLRNLHLLHPTWKFQALKTNISWATLTKNQHLTGRNLTRGTVSWQSYEKGAYDWTNNTWYSFDSGNWVQACREVIDYYLDPRNFLDNSNIYQFLVLSNDGNDVSPDTVDAMLKNTFMYQAPCSDGLTYAEALIKAGKEAGASPYMLAARIKMEQGSKGNKLAHGTVDGYEGYYNHFDIGAYAHHDRSAMVNGAIYAKNKGWNSAYKAILGGANFLVKSYIAVEQNTLYLQKYDVVDGGNGYYSHQYMTNISAAVSEGSVLRNGIQGTAAEESALTFLIPVYTDMPVQAAPMPKKTGSANNLLASLSVKGHEFTVEFDKYTEEYELFVDVGEIEISAETIDKDAAVTGTGTHKLKYGVNEIEIKVTATNGNVRTYTVSVSTTNKDNGEITPSPANPTPANPTPAPPTETPAERSFECGFTVSGSMINGVSVGTTLSAFRGNLTVKGYSAVFTDYTGKTKSDGEVMKTGDKISLVYNGKEEKAYYVVIAGDVNCDGRLTSVDLLAAQKHILEISKLKNEAAVQAADFNGDGKVNSRDLLACQKRILGLS